MKCNTLLRCCHRAPRHTAPTDGLAGRLVALDDDLVCAGVHPAGVVPRLHPQQQFQVQGKGFFDAQGHPWCQRRVAVEQRRKRRPVRGSKQPITAPLGTRPGGAGSSGGALSDARGLDPERRGHAGKSYPTQASFHRLDLQLLADNWTELVAGIKWAIETLEGEAIFDEARLPTVAVLPVLVALHNGIPQALDEHGRAKVLLRSYLWRAFFTRRYTNAAATRALQDLRGLSATVSSGSMDRTAPIFDEEQYPLPSIEELERASWPRRRDTLARAILAVSLKGGARDFADDEPATRHHLAQREYHHLFPDHLLTGEGRLSSDHSLRALNCALVTWNTNRTIAAKEPIQYLQERTSAAALGEDEVRRRLQSHLVPYDELAVGGYSAAASETARASQSAHDYEVFLRQRASMMRAAIEVLCRGEVWPQIE